jgi:hypothetical protein
VPGHSERERREWRERDLRDLSEILETLNHNPESFAKVIGRNPSGFRRIVNGDVTPSPAMVADILTGLYAEGYQGQPGHVRQVKDGLRGSMWKRQWWIDRAASRVPSRGLSASGAPRQGVPPAKGRPHQKETTDPRMKRIFDLAARSLGREESYERLRRVFADEPKG